MPAPIYCIDTNIIVILERYMPGDVHVGVWEQLEDLIREGRAQMPREAYEELTRVDDGCAAWAMNQDGFVKNPLDPAIIDVVGQITRAHPGWVQDRTNAADPWIVAHAKVDSNIIVTDERRKGPGSVPDRNLKIPNVADEHQVRCVDFNTMARDEGWRFTR